MKIMMNWLKNDNPNWPYISVHRYIILFIGACESGKTNVLLNKIKHQRPDIDEIYFIIYKVSIAY